MRLRIDREADAVTLILSNAAIEDSAEIADGIVADYDAEGCIVGIEVLDASKRAGDPQALAEMRFELPGVALLLTMQLKPQSGAGGGGSFVSGSDRFHRW